VSPIKGIDEAVISLFTVAEREVSAIFFGSRT